MPKKTCSPQTRKNLFFLFSIGILASISGLVGALSMFAGLLRIENPFWSLLLGYVGVVVGWAFSRLLNVKLYAFLLGQKQ